jgi:hypothetical protein
MTFTLTLAALRRHPISVSITSLLTILTASLLGVSAPIAVVAWGTGTLAFLEIWYVVEPSVLRRFCGYRSPTFAEHQHLEAALGCSHGLVLIDDTPHLVYARGLRCLILSRDLLDVLDDRMLSGLVSPTSATLHAANLAGAAVVWIGNLPLLLVWQVVRLIGQLGRLLAMVVGTSLVMPMVVCRSGFLRWAGLACTGLLVSLCSSVLISEGFAAAGLGLLVVWPVLPLLKAVSAWESRRSERAADRATISAGFGPQLLEALDFLTLAEFRPEVGGLLGMLRMPGAPLPERAERVRLDLQLQPSVA